MKITAAEFKRRMQTVADGWNEGDARKAAGCFSEDAIYVEPPGKQPIRAAPSCTNSSEAIRVPTCR